MLTYFYDNIFTQCRSILISKRTSTSHTEEVLSRFLALVTPFAVLEKVGEMQVCLATMLKLELSILVIQYTVKEHDGRDRLIVELVF